MSGRTVPGRDGGPVAERLSAWVGARAVPDAADAARLLEQVSGQRPELATKRTLIAVSHAIERAVLAAPRAEPTIVLALFQRMEYFERERAVYERLARTGALVAVGFCEGPEHPLPDGVARVELDPAEPLVNEWSVVAVTPRAGAFLVATDQHGIDPGASSLEAGRRFRTRWGLSRVQATVEMARLRLVLGERLPAAMVRSIDRLLGETMSTGADPASSSGTPQEVWATTAAFHLAERLSSARTGSARLRAQLTDAHAAAAARHAAGVDQQSGLTTPDFLHRWSDGDGTTVLPVGIGLFDLPAVSAADPDGTDPRAAYHAARRIAAAVSQPLGPVDAAVRLSGREFLVVLPGASELHLARVCDDILDQLALTSDGYPYVPLTGGLATTVTRHRPLPLPELRDALAGLGDTAASGPRIAGHTAVGDTIVVCGVGSADAPVPEEAQGSGAGDPEVGEPGDGGPGAGLPGSGGLGAGWLGSGALGSGALGSGGPGAGALGAGALDAGDLGAGALDAGDLGAGAPGAGALGAGRPGAGGHRAGEPGAWAPAAARSGVRHIDAGGPGTTGSGAPGSDATESGIPSSGTPESGTPGSSTPGSGTPGSGGFPGSDDAGSDVAGAGVAGSGAAGSETAGPGTDRPGSAESGSSVGSQDAAGSGPAGDDAQDGTPSRTGQQVLGYGRFPRPYPAAARAGTEDTAELSARDEPTPAHAWHALAGEPTRDGDARSDWDGSSWDRPTGGDGEPGGSREPDDGDRRPEPPPWRTRNDDGSTPATAVDEVRNLFGRRN